jgi:hypothetical protein
MKKVFAHGTVTISAVIALVAPLLVRAQAFKPLADTPSGSKLGQLYGTSTDLPTFLGNLFTAALSIGAILAVLRLAYAGYEYMTSDAWSSKTHAREVIGDVVLGLLLLLSVWLILHQINPDILNLNFLQHASQLPATSQSGQSSPFTQ